MPETDRPALDTSNRCLVARTATEEFLRDQEPRIVIFRPPLTGQRIGIDEALNLAAWLVALADPAGEQFARVLEQVRNT